VRPILQPHENERKLTFQVDQNAVVVGRSRRKSNLLAAKQNLSSINSLLTRKLQRISLPECRHLSVASNLASDTGFFHLPRTVPGIFDASIEGDGHNTVPSADLGTGASHLHGDCAKRT